MANFEEAKKTVKYEYSYGKKIWYVYGTYYQTKKVNCTLGRKVDKQVPFIGWYKTDAEEAAMKLEKYDLTIEQFVEMIENKSKNAIFANWAKDGLTAAKVVELGIADDETAKEYAEYLDKLNNTETTITELDDTQVANTVENVNEEHTPVIDEYLEKCIKRLKVPADIAQKVREGKTVIWFVRGAFNQKTGKQNILLRINAKVATAYDVENVFRESNGFHKSIQPSDIYIDIALHDEGYVSFSEPEFAAEYNWFSGNIPNKMIVDKRLVRSVEFIPVADAETAPASVEIDALEYAVSVESQEIAVQAEIENAINSAADVPKFFKAKIKTDNNHRDVKTSGKTEKLQTAINFLVRNIFAQIGALTFTAEVDDVTGYVPKAVLELNRNNSKANWEFANSRVKAMFEKAVAIELSNKTAITAQVEKLNPVKITKWLRNVAIDDHYVLMNCFAGCFCNKYADFSEMVAKLTDEIYHLSWYGREINSDWANFAILLDEYKDFDGKLIAELDKAIMDTINPPPAEVDVEDYAVSIEAQDVALQAEIENANVEVEVNPFKPEFYFDWDWQIGMRIRDMKGSVVKLTAIKLEVARYFPSAQSEQVYAENALIIRQATSDAGNKFAPSSDLIVYCHNDKGKPMAFIKTIKLKSYTQYCRGGRHDHMYDYTLVFKKYVKADRLKYALALFELTLEQLESLYSSLKIGEQVNISDSEIAVVDAEVDAPDETVETASESNATKFGLVENNSDDKTIAPIMALEPYAPRVEVDEVKTALEIANETYDAAVSKCAKYNELGAKVIEKRDQASDKYNSLINLLKRKIRSFHRSKHQQTKERIAIEITEIEKAAQESALDFVHLDNFFKALRCEYRKVNRQAFNAAVDGFNARKAEGLRYAVKINRVGGFVRKDFHTVADAVTFIYQNFNSPKDAWRIFAESFEDQSIYENDIASGRAIDIDLFEELIDEFDDKITDAQIATTSPPIVKPANPAEEFNQIVIRSMHNFTLGNYLDSIDELKNFCAKVTDKKLFETAIAELQEWIGIARAEGIEVADAQIEMIDSAAPVIDSADDYDDEEEDFVEENHIAAIDEDGDDELIDAPEPRQKINQLTLYPSDFYVAKAVVKNIKQSISNITITAKKFLKAEFTYVEYGGIAKPFQNVSINIDSKRRAVIVAPFLRHFQTNQRQIEDFTKIVRRYLTGGKQGAISISDYRIYDYKAMNAHINAFKANHDTELDTSEAKRIYVQTTQAMFDIIQQIAPDNYQIKSYTSEGTLFVGKNNGMGFSIELHSLKKIFPTNNTYADATSIFRVIFGKVNNGKLQSDRLIAIYANSLYSKPENIADIQKWFDLPIIKFTPVEYGEPITIYTGNGKTFSEIEKTINANVAARDLAADTKIIITCGKKKIMYKLMKDTDRDLNTFVVDTSGKSVNPNGGDVVMYADCIYGNGEFDLPLDKRGNADIKRTDKITKIEIIPVIKAANETTALETVTPIDVDAEITTETKLCSKSDMDMQPFIKLIRDTEAYIFYFNSLKEMIALHERWIAEYKQERADLAAGVITAVDLQYDDVPDFCNDEIFNPDEFIKADYDLLKEYTEHLTQNVSKLKAGVKLIDNPSALLEAIDKATALLTPTTTAPITPVDTPKTYTSITYTYPRHNAAISRSVRFIGNVSESFAPP